MPDPFFYVSCNLCIKKEMHIERLLSTADAKGVLDVLLSIEVMVYIEELSCAADLLNQGYGERLRQGGKGQAGVEASS